MPNRRRLLQSALFLLAAPTLAPAAQGPNVKVLGRQPLAGKFEGLEAVRLEVTYPPGAASAAHKHPGFVLGYVIEGRFRFAVDDEPERILEAGDVFYEPPGAVHAISANPSETETTRILATIVAEPGEELTKPA